MTASNEGVMHNASTKQRLSALRRKLGIFSGMPRWVKERRARLARLAAETAHDTADVVAPSTAETELIFPAPAESSETRSTFPVPPVKTEIALTPPATRPQRRAARGFTIAVALAGVATALVALRAAGPQPDASTAVASAGVQRGSATATVAAAAAAVARLETGSAAAAGGFTVEVRRGDTLWRLAEVHLGDPGRWPELHAANAGQIGDPDLIFPGQQLRVPQPARS